MGFRINTNTDALSAQHNLAAAGGMYSKSVERLSSGLRINRAGDDAAGLSISEKLRAQVKGTDQASRNAQDGISMIQTAEGALNEVHSMLQRMRELSVQGANDTLSSDDRKAVNAELQQLKAEIDATAQRTQFNGKNLLSGDVSTKVDAASAFKVGSTLATTNTVAVSGIDMSGAVGGGATYTFAASGTNLTLTRSTDSVSQTLDMSAYSNASGTSTIDFSQLGVKITLSGDTAKASADLLTDLDTQVITTAAASTSAVFQVGANSTDFMSADFKEVKLTGATAAAMSTLNTQLASYDTKAGLGTATSTDAQSLISALDDAITYVSDVRGGLGAKQNRLEHAVANLGVASQNLSASESRIRDADVAAETVQFTKAQILQQAGTAILAQANQSSQGVLSLLR